MGMIETYLPPVFIERTILSRLISKIIGVDLSEPLIVYFHSEDHYHLRFDSLDAVFHASEDIYPVTYFFGGKSGYAVVFGHVRGWRLTILKLVSGYRHHEYGVAD